MTYFNGEVMSALTQNGIELTSREMSGYVALCQFAEQQGEEWISKVNLDHGQPYAVYHGQASKNDPKMTHWMLFPQFTPPRMVNLISGERREMKINPPKQEAPAPAAAVKQEIAMKPSAPIKQEIAMQPSAPVKQEIAMKPTAPLKQEIPAPQITPVKQNNPVNQAPAIKAEVKPSTSPHLPTPVIQPSVPSKYLNQAVQDLLRAQGINLTAEQVVAYRMAAQKSENAVAMKKLSKHTLKLPFSIWQLPKAFGEKGFSPWLALPTPQGWEGKAEQNGVKTLNKVLMNLETGQRKVVKIRRPQDARITQHVYDTDKELLNNLVLNVPMEKATSKTYLFMPFFGEHNLAALLNDSRVTSDEILEILQSSGKRLQDLHNKGYIHADFKAANLVVDRRQKQVTLIDNEFMITQRQGMAGIDKLYGTREYQHPDWLRESELRVRHGQPINYSTRNDVYAFLVTAEKCLRVASVRSDLTTKQKINQVLSQVYSLKNRQFKQLPTLDQIMGLLITLGLAPAAPNNAPQNQYKGNQLRK